MAGIGKNYKRKPKGERGFNMRSGNGPLQFKQMGSSPAKLVDVYTDGPDGDGEYLGTGANAVKRALEIERTNNKIKAGNIKNSSEYSELENQLYNAIDSGDVDAQSQIEAQLNEIENEGTTKLTYTGEEAKMRQNIREGNTIQSDESGVSRLQEGDIGYEGVGEFTEDEFGQEETVTRSFSSDNVTLISDAEERKGTWNMSPVNPETGKPTTEQEFKEGWVKRKGDVSRNIAVDAAESVVPYKKPAGFKMKGMSFGKGTNYKKK